MKLFYTLTALVAAMQTAGAVNIGDQVLIKYSETEGYLHEDPGGVSLSTKASPQGMEALWAVEAAKSGWAGYFSFRNQATGNYLKGHLSMCKAGGVGGSGRTASWLVVAGTSGDYLKNGYYPNKCCIADEVPDSSIASEPACHSANAVVEFEANNWECISDSDCDSTNDEYCLANQCTPRCPERSPPANGQLFVSGRELNSWISYSCNEGFQLDGGNILPPIPPESYESYCTQSGTQLVWQGFEPTCVATCPQLGDFITNGYVFTSNFHIVGSQATYGCNNGYGRVGNLHRTCQADRTWSGSQPVCEPTCSSDADCALNQDSLFCTKEVCVNSFCQQADACSSNELCIEDSDSCVECLSDSDCDSGSDEYCHTNQCTQKCPQLSSIANGQVVVGLRVLDGSASYSCNSGFKFDGVDPQLPNQYVRRCQGQSGAQLSWDGSNPICTAYCPELPQISNGYRGYTNGNLAGSHAHYGCNEGYELVGDATRTCQGGTRTWTGEEPVCQPLDTCSTDADCPLNQDSLFCTKEQCVDSICQPTDACDADQFCIEDSDRCVECIADSDCPLNQDDIFCTRQECEGGVCYGLAACSVDETCNEDENRCDPGPCQSHADCPQNQDEFFCTQQECVGGVCYGLAACSVDETCNEEQDTCDPNPTRHLRLNSA